jgi:hypothetical protein
MVPDGSGEMVLEVGTFNTHAEFTTGRPNGRVEPTAIMPIPIGLSLHTTEKIPLPHLLLTRRWLKCQLPVSFLWRPHYGSY